MGNKGHNPGQVSVAPYLLLAPLIDGDSLMTAAGIFGMFFFWL
jgi:hypothetical protein